jgi:hypothetical protein
MRNNPVFGDHGPSFAQAMIVSRVSFTRAVCKAPRKIKIDVLVDR